MGSGSFRSAVGPGRPASPAVSPACCARWQYGIKCPGAGVVSPGCSKLVRQPVPGWPDGAPGRGLAGHRGRAPYADRRADRVREDTGRVPGLYRPDLPGARCGYRARCGAPGGVRVTAEGAGRRHLAEPRDTARRDRGHRGPDGTAGPGHPRRGKDGGHGRRGARRDAQAPAGLPDHHARVAVPAGHGRTDPGHAGPGRHGHRGRDPRGRGQQAGLPPGPDPRAAGAPGRGAGPAHRAVRHPAPHRDCRPPPGRRGPRPVGTGRVTAVRDRGLRPPPGTGPGPRAAR